MLPQVVFYLVITHTPAPESKGTGRLVQPIFGSLSRLFPNAVMVEEGANVKQFLQVDVVILAQILGMDVVAEGVETKEQLALLRKLGCENGQGYYFSRPATATDAEKIIADTCARPQAAAPRAAERAAGALVDDKVKGLRLVDSA